MARHAARKVRRRLAVVAAIVLLAAVVGGAVRASRDDPPASTSEPIGGAAAPSVSVGTSFDPIDLSPGEEATVRVKMSADRELRVSELSVRFGRVDGGGWVPSVPSKTEFWVGIRTSETTFPVTFSEPGTFRYWVECRPADGRPPFKAFPPRNVRVR